MLCGIVLRMSPEGVRGMAWHWKMSPMCDMWYGPDGSSSDVRTCQKPGSGDSGSGHEHDGVHSAKIDWLSWYDNGFVPSDDLLNTHWFEDQRGRHLVPELGATITQEITDTKSTTAYECDFNGYF